MCRIWTLLSFKMRPVLFLFYTVESVFNMLLISYHIRGFLTLSLDFLSSFPQISHYVYIICIYMFTMITLFASINICTGHMYSLKEEIIRNFLGFVMFLYISLDTLENAESDFHLLYIMSNKTIGVEEAVHPFFDYMRSQAVSALAGGVVYLLHCIIAVDVLLSNDESQNEDESTDQSYDSDYVPVRLYFLGESIHTRLDQYKWFNDFARGSIIPI